MDTHRLPQERTPGSASNGAPRTASYFLSHHHARKSQGAPQQLRQVAQLGQKPTALFRCFPQATPCERGQPPWAVLGGALPLRGQAG